MRAYTQREAWARRLRTRGRSPQPASQPYDRSHDDRNQAADGCQACRGLEDRFEQRPPEGDSDEEEEDAQDGLAAWQWHLVPRAGGAYDP